MDTSSRFHAEAASASTPELPLQSASLKDVSTPSPTPTTAPLPASAPDLPAKLQNVRKAAKPAQNSTSFYGSQVGGASVISYSYTDDPWRLLAHDVGQFFRLAWALPYILWPIWPADSGPLDELAWTLPNLWCLALHTLLAVLQLFFLLGLLPAALFMPTWAAIISATLALALNHGLCLLLNGFGYGRSNIEYQSSPYCAADLPEHAHEQWVFLNGVAVGRHWMQSNLDRLALTFGRPILGIHNRTSGILFDVIECLVQRNFTYATSDVRECYSILKKKLYRPDISKVVLILHSQGAIEGGLVLDWLLQELPQDLLAKLEVYTFGSAANHFNNPHRTVVAQRREAEACESLAGLVPGLSPGQSFEVGSGLLRETAATAASPSHISARAIGHIEHYAHTSDFVALWGVLHFVRTARRSHTMPRFMGRVFAHSSSRGGHQLCQHYLDGMFPLERDPQTGRIKGCAETGNEFMESLLQFGQEGDESADLKKAIKKSWLAGCDDEAFGPGGRTESASAVEIHSTSPILSRQSTLTRTVKVKDVSRLWQYRNGRSPDDRRLTRLATL